MTPGALWIVVPLALGGIAAALATARRGRRQLVATTIAAVALVGLALAPRPERIGDATLLLTHGADSSHLAGGEWGTTPSPDVVAIGDDPSWPRWIERLHDVGALTRRADAPRSLRITGHGLDPWDVERLAGAGRFEVTVTDPPPAPDGITRISWRRDLSVGQAMTVTGTITGGGTLRLEGPGGRVEQIVSARPEETPFTLRLVPPGPGRFLFDLFLLRPGSEERLGAIDVHVRPAGPPRLVWLERAPSFETRHVKQWLADSGGAVAVRTTVSRDRSRYEYHNLDRVDLSRLTPARLEDFDVVVVDAVTWADLPQAERQAIEQGVRSGSLGLVLRLGLQSDVPPRAPFGVAVRRIADLDRLMVRPATLEEPPEPIAIPPFELAGAGVPILRDGAGRALTVSRPLGSGSVAITALTGSYRWVLGGRADAHRAYWVTLLEAVAPVDEQPRWLIPGGPAPENEPLTVTLAGEPPVTAELTEPDGRRSAVPLRQHPIRPDCFSTTLWPRRAGWHRLEADGAVALFHIAEGSDWQAWRLTRRRDATALAATQGSLPTGAVDRSVPWLRLLALATLLVALVSAWVDERRSTA
jgi:hypothetical protein